MANHQNPTAGLDWALQEHRRLAAARSPFAGLPQDGAEYAGTDLETPAERRHNQTRGDRLTDADPYEPEDVYRSQAALSEPWDN